MGRYAIIVVTTLFILMAFFVIATNNTQTLSIDRNIRTLRYNQSRYIAVSASQIAVANFLAGDWSINSDNTEIFFPVNNSSFINWTDVNGSYRIKAIKTGNIVTITVEGKSENTTDAVTVVVNLQLDSGTISFDKAVYASSNITLTGSSQVFGNGGTAATASNSVDLSWSTMFHGDFQVGPGADYNDVIYSHGWGRKPEDNISGSITTLEDVPAYPVPEFPDFPTLPDRGNFEAGWWPIPTGGHQISEDGYYNNLTVHNQLIINVGTGTRRIRVNNLNVDNNGHIKVNGAGNLIFYVDNNFTLTGSSRINGGFPGNLYDGDTDKVHTFYAGSNAIQFAGNTRHFGSMFLKDADITITGSGGVTGHIITGGSNVSIDGNAEANVRLLYAPDAHVGLTGSARVRGPIISSSFSAEGNARVFYEAVDVEIPELQIGTGGTADKPVLSWN